MLRPLKLRFSYTENRNVQACESALEGFNLRVVLLQDIMRYLTDLMTSCFAYDTRFNAFVLFLVLNFVWRTIDDFSAFTVTMQLKYHVYMSIQLNILLLLT